MLLLTSAAAGCATALPGEMSSAVAPSPARAQDERDVLAAVERLFDAMRTRDTVSLRTMSHPELRLFVPGEAAGAPVVRVSTIGGFIDVIAASRELLDERAIAPEVRIDGNLAAVWTYYEFFRGGAFSHCGVDAFHFARTAAGWQMIGLAYTTRVEGCRGR
jgi:hypothetical protein